MLNTTRHKQLSDIPAVKLQELSTRSFYFGHMSVGYNIIDGLNLLMKDYPELKFHIADSNDPSLIKPGAFLHSKVGKNFDPTSKVLAFEDVINSGVGNSADAAFLKFCYVDANKFSDAQQIFANYKSSIETLKAKYPKTRFVHFTMPIQTNPKGLKRMVKKLLGRNVRDPRDNVVRGEFNEIMRREYDGKEPVFDIAKLESIANKSDKVYSSTVDGKAVEIMAPENTTDGGHLSETGKRWIAEQLIIFLAELDYK